MRDPSEKTIISAQVPSELRDELAQLARQHDLSLSDEIRRAVRLHLRVEDPGGSGLPPRPVPAERSSETSEFRRQSSSPPPLAGPEEGAA